jgi:hypothetical protein
MQVQHDYTEELIIKRLLVEKWAFCHPGKEDAQDQWRRCTADIHFHSATREAFVHCNWRRSRFVLFEMSLGMSVLIGRVSLLSLDTLKKIDLFGASLILPFFSYCSGRGWSVGREWCIVAQGTSLADGWWEWACKADWYAGSFCELHHGVSPWFELIWKYLIAYICR